MFLFPFSTLRTPVLLIYVYHV
uniref:Uncharacterized protein n=1 Tax=Arundo donax TaxID=35708 RepID=A0A0A9AK22_ARUDO